MIKRILAALAVTMLGVLAFATPAHATIPEIQLPYGVGFSPEKPACDGAVDTATTNNLNERFGIGLTFKVNNKFVNVDPESTEHTLVNYPDSQDIVVKLVGLYDADDEDEPVLTEAAASKRADLSFELQKEWHYNWTRPAGCWKVDVTSECNGDRLASVENTSPAPGDFLIQVDTTPAVEIHVAGNATFTAVYHDQATVTVTVDKETTSTFAFKAPVCPSPVPTPFPTEPAPGNPDVLPVTGADLSGPVLAAELAGGALLLLAGVWAVRAVLKRRKVA